MAEPHHRRALYRGPGDVVARAFELIAIPVLFGLGGHWLDSRLGTAPVVTIILVVLAVVGQAARLHFR